MLLKSCRTKYQIRKKWTVEAAVKLIRSMERSSIVLELQSTGSEQEGAILDTIGVVNVIHTRQGSLVQSFDDGCLGCHLWEVS